MYNMPIVLLFAVVFISCGQRKVVSTAPAPVQEITHTDQILFLYLKIHQDSTAKAGESIFITQRQTVSGLLKSKLKIPQVAQPGDLICTFLDKKGSDIISEILEDPLTASTEYPEEDGTMHRVNIEKAEADLFLRIQYSDQLSKLRINKVMTDGKVVQVGEFGL